MLAILVRMWAWVEFCAAHRAPVTRLCEMPMLVLA